MPDVTHRESLLANAVRDREITEAEVPKLRTQYDANPSQVTHLLTAEPSQGGLMAGLHGAADEYPSEWLPEVHRPSPPTSVAND
jgi:hypothetical protein